MHPRAKDLTGMRFGRWTVIGDSGQRAQRQVLWDCVCDCGTVRKVRGSILRQNRTGSCGCATNGKPITFHGMSRTPEYVIWQAMLQRCTNPNYDGWNLYGGRGISVCEQWMDFSKFISDMGRRPSPVHSLDRFPDMDGNYEPGNVRWATPKMQALNRRTTRLFDFHGEQLSIADIARRVGAQPGYFGKLIDSIGFDAAVRKYER